MWMILFAYTAFKTYKYNCKLAKKFRNMLEMEPKVYIKNTQHFNSKVSIFHICMDMNLLMKVQLEKIEPFARGEFILVKYFVPKCAVLNFSLKNPV